MSLRTLTILLVAAAAALLAAVPAQAAMVYVKGADGDEPTVYVARDDGTQPRRLAAGSFPRISRDGAQVAYQRSADSDDRVEEVRVVRARGGRARRVMRSEEIRSLQFSPDSKLLAATLGGRRIAVVDVATGKQKIVARGFIAGVSVSPDSKSLVYGKATSDDAGAPSDLYVVDTAGLLRPRRITTDKRSLNPLWGPDTIVFDKQETRRGDVPAYNLHRVQPDGTGESRLTRLTIPSGVSGLVPVEFADDGRRLLADFNGPQTSAAFAVGARTGQTRAISKDSKAGFVGYDLSADGRTVLGHTRGIDPRVSHDIATVPYAGGRPKRMIRKAAYPDWSQ